MPNVLILTPRPSDGARALADALGATIRRNSSTRRTKRSSKVINWGCSSKGDTTHAVHVNDPAGVAIVCNKLDFFVKARELTTHIPAYTTDAAVAQFWVDGGARTMVRRTLTGHSAEGLEVVNEGAIPPPDAPLYTKYVPGLEYRIHVVGTHTSVIQKRRRNGLDRTPNQNAVKNFDNGWIYSADLTHEVPAAIQDEAVNLLDHIGLDFGAFDLRYKPSTGEYAWLEVNSAPGLVGRTIQLYADGIKELL